MESTIAVNMKSFCYLQRPDLRSSVQIQTWSLYLGLLCAKFFLGTLELLSACKAFIHSSMESLLSHFGWYRCSHLGIQKRLASASLYMFEDKAQSDIYFQFLTLTMGTVVKRCKWKKTTKLTIISVVSHECFSPTFRSGSLTLQNLPPG